MNAPLTKRAPERAWSIKRIVVAVALSPHSEATARYAVEIAKAFGASIVLVHVHAPPAVNENITQAGYQDMSWQQQGAQEALSDLTKFASRRSGATPHPRFGARHRQPVCPDAAIG